MLRIVVLILIVIATVAVAFWAASSPADVAFSLPGWEGETSRPVLAIMIALLGAVMAVIWGLIAWVFGIPAKLSKGHKQSRVEKARAALADGLIAAEGGDAISAEKQARKVVSLTRSGSPDRKLALLLSARAAEAKGDWIEAEKIYAELSREKGAELAGLRGLAAAAVKRGDHNGAAAHSRAAFQLKSKADWPFGSLFELQTKAADWLGAAETLGDGVRRGAIDQESASRRRAVLLTAEAARIRRTDVAEAEKLVLEAMKVSAGFPPAALFAGRLQLAAGRLKKAQSSVETAWRIRPHPALSILWSDLKLGESSEEHSQRILKLASTNPDHRESRILVGEAAIATGDWSKATEVFAPLLEDGATGRLCALMQAVARGRGDDEEAARWSRLAMSAAREPDWSDIDPNGRAFDYSDEDWARMVYTFGDGNVLIHPRYEEYGHELEATSKLSLPPPPKTEETPQVEDQTDTVKPEQAITPPADYATRD